MNTETPETDAQHLQFEMGEFTLDFCRKLERERKEFEHQMEKYAAEARNAIESYELAYRERVVLKKHVEKLMREIAAISSENDKIHP